MGKETLTQILADMRTELKDPGGAGILWTDAELTRGYQQADADLSRFLPRELIYEETLKLTITGEAFTTPLDTDIDRIVDAESLNGKVSGDSCTVDGQPDVARPLTAIITDADDSITGLVIVISGFDENGLTASETLTYALGQSKSLTGKVYFKYVSTVILAQVGGTPGVADVLEMGIGAYTNVWVSLTYKPIKPSTEKVSTGVRDTDFYMDYANGRIKAISGGLLAAYTSYTIGYTKSDITVDLSAMTDLIRVVQVECPVGGVPQATVTHAMFAGMLTITGGGESDSQAPLADKSHLRVYYDARHIPATAFTPGTEPYFLQETVKEAACAYALLIYSLKCEHLSLADLASARTALTAATTAQTALGNALTATIKYLNNNTGADAAGVLAAITTDITELRTGVGLALAAAKTYLAAVATSDLAGSDGVWTDEVPFVTGATNPSAAQYLKDGDDKLLTINLAGEGVDVPRVFAEYAQTAYASITRAYEQKRSDFLQSAVARTNAALGSVQEAAQRIANIRTYIDQSAGYTTISAYFLQEAQQRLGVVNSYLTQAARYMEAAGGDLVMADRFRTEAISKRDEVWGIWKDRKQYIGDFASASLRQITSS